MFAHPMAIMWIVGVEGTSWKLLIIKGTMKTSDPDSPSYVSILSSFPCDVSQVDQIHHTPELRAIRGFLTADVYIYLSERANVSVAHGYYTLSFRFTL
jgi:hypothetical protein